MIELRNITKSFGDLQVLEGLDLDIPTGKTTLIMGRSGVGKSVLLKLILRLLPLEQGTIYIDGEDTTSYSEEEMLPIRKKIGMLFQGNALFDSMDVWHNIAYPLLEHTDMEKEEIDKRVKQMLGFIDLLGTANKMPSELSGGMQKRVSLARAMITRPDYIFYDEPTTGLDPITSGKINELLQRTKAKYNVSSIVVTHEIAHALAVGDKFTFLEDGNIIFSGSQEELLNTNNEVIQQFVEDALWKTT